MAVTRTSIRRRIQAAQAAASENIETLKAQLHAHEGDTDIVMRDHFGRAVSMDQVALTIATWEVIAARYDELAGMVDRGWPVEALKPCLTHIDLNITPEVLAAHAA